MDSFLTSCSVESGLVHGIGADEESDTEDVVIKDDYNNSGMVTENRFSLVIFYKKRRSPVLAVVAISIFIVFSISEP